MKSVVFLADGMADRPVDELAGMTPLEKASTPNMDALAQNTAMLPHVELNLPQTALGYDTVAQIQIGIVGGYVGSMEYLIRRTKAEMTEPDDQIKVIATGGLAGMVASHTDAIDLVDSQLILEGLVRIYRAYRNSH